LAGIGAVVALGKNEIHYPENYHLVFATIWAVIAMTIALITHGLIPPRVPTKNVVKDRTVSIACATTLYFSLAAAARFVFAIWSLLFSLPPPV
jgi:hypothetical protein